MKLSKLLYLIVFLIYIYIILGVVEPLVGNKWITYSIFAVGLFLLSFIIDKAEVHVKALQKRIDPQLSVLIVFGIFGTLFVIQLLS
ncbi:hypothetical protein [Sutcliffiella cohnii]|uniref:Uncharacterized protein n=1 Tax=Sutcliffiella cohnii TaxID=33932 RepID=A0A223KN97_9BACI|nr:hypothetical protein [Sutcliffiella cohnii]AST90828.1 hypothetical protein BC6307_05770 [Sutcliffiella cohnii]MED4017887.1 hypothetical protein [Sutcliffiella cohnii]